MYQMVNYFLVSSAILATAYAAAINGKHYGIAVVLSLAEIGITAFVVLLVLRELRSAASVVPALVEVRDQIAIRLKTDSIRMVSTPPGREQRALCGDYRLDRRAGSGPDRYHLAAIRADPLRQPALCG